MKKHLASLTLGLACTVGVLGVGLLSTTAIPQALAAPAIAVTDGSSTTGGDANNNLSLTEISEQNAQRLEIPELIGKEVPKPNPVSERLDEVAVEMVEPSVVRPTVEGKSSISSPYGNRTHPVYGTTRFHHGTDYAIGSGSPVYAVTDGEVVEVQKQDTDTYGLTVIVYHPEQDVYSMYAHLLDGSIRVEVGDKVQAGQRIASMGSTGLSTGPHLHLEIRTENKYGATVDSEKWLEEQLEKNDESQFKKTTEYMNSAENNAPVSSDEESDSAGSNSAE